MALVCIVVSFVILTATYLYVSLRERSYVNVLTPAFVFFIPANFLLELFHFSLFGPSASSLAYMLMYSAYTAHFVALAFGYSMKVPALRLPFSQAAGTGGSKLLPYVVFGAAFLLYLPILIEFRDLLTTPRQIYEQTRSGYGLNYFLSTALCYVAVILMLFKRGVRASELIVFLSAAMVFMWLHGSKATMLTIVFIVAMYWVYVLRRRISLIVFLVFGVGLAGMGVLLFFVTTPGLLTDGGALGLAEYSGYTRSGMLVIDSNLGPTYGRLTFESEFYTRIPRLLFPGKPDDFGSFYLAKTFYPEEFARGTGAPAFGYGTLFADFKALGPLIVFATSFLCGAMLKMFVAGLRKHRTPGDFILMLFAAEVPVIPLGAVFLLPEHVLVAIATNALCALRLVPRTRRAATQVGEPGSPVQQA